MFSFFSGLGFPTSSYSNSLVWFHGYLCSWLLGIFLFVLTMAYYVMVSKYFFKLTGAKYSASEALCSILPLGVVASLMLPSMALLYEGSSLDASGEMTVKIVAHQWYWSYEYCDIEGLELDSYMVAQEDLGVGGSRLLEVDARLILPCDVAVRFCLTSADVIHSWSVPSAGIKMDCVPGVLNVFTMKFPFVGVFYGQCSELCGVGHSYMPIVVEVCTWESFFFWVQTSVY